MTAQAENHGGTLGHGGLKCDAVKGKNPRANARAFKIVAEMPIILSNEFALAFWLFRYERRRSHPWTRYLSCWSSSVSLSYWFGSSHNTTARPAITGRPILWRLPGSYPSLHVKCPRNLRSWRKKQQNLPLDWRRNLHGESSHQKWSNGGTVMWGGWNSNF